MSGSGYVIYKLTLRWLKVPMGVIFNDFNISELHPRALKHDHVISTPLFQPMNTIYCHVVDCDLESEQFKIYCRRGIELDTRQGFLTVTTCIHVLLLSTKKEKARWIDKINLGQV